MTLRQSLQESEGPPLGPVVSGAGSGAVSLLNEPVSLVTPSPDPLVTPGGVLVHENGPLLGPVERTWVAPHDAINILASNPSNWSPEGAPQPGDTLDMQNGQMQISGYDLRGDPLNLGNGWDQTRQLLELNNQATIQLNVLPNATTTVDVDGVAYVDLVANGAAINFNLNPGASVQTKSFDLENSTSQVNGGMAFLNTGDVWVHDSSLLVNSDLEGTGKVHVTSDSSQSSVELLKSVSTGQSFDVDGNPSALEPAKLKIDDPKAFDGTVNLDYAKTVLVGLQADSYSFKDDLLSVYFKGTVVDTLKLHSPSSFGGQDLHLSVYATGTGVLVDNSGLGGTDGVLLPQMS